MSAGFMCKVCGGPSPLGVGYVDGRPGAARASESLTVCGCGHSRIPSERAPGQRPAWCLDDAPEDHSSARDGQTMFSTWSRYFTPAGAPWGVALIAEDTTTADGIMAGPTRVQVFDPERPLTLEEAEAYALEVIEAVKAAQTRL
ncbi:hypothetical protein M3D00_05000 [Dietzia cinnamea]|uniref:hypothetical protein n=1 Tax=Dietzia cinnamea TaxID=321318 RepID=UPI0021A4EEE7|nr:hypothetical protein [Dietzia cinnamea]MCT2029515.1 hypothetical protein [Dietzia cinnamea]